MKKLLVLCAALVSFPAFAISSPDFGALEDSGQQMVTPHKKMHRCLKRGWRASRPSDEQKAQAETIMADAKAVMAEHKDAIVMGVQAMKDAWKKHPVSKDEVVAAENTLKEHIMPVKEAFRDAGIEVLNLLSAEQRTNFDTAFESCLEKKKKDR